LVVAVAVAAAVKLQQPCSLRAVLRVAARACSTLCMTLPISALPKPTQSALAGHLAALTAALRVAMAAWAAHLRSAARLCQLLLPMVAGAAKGVAPLAPLMVVAGVPVF
jgi:hypothetical protein